MRWLIVFAAAALILGACGSDDGSGSDETVELPAEVAEAYENYTDATGSADGEAMLDFVTDDFSFLSYGDEVQKAEFRATYVTKNYGSFELEEIGERTVVGGGDTYIVSIPERATTPLVAVGISTVRLVNVDGTWLVDMHRFVGEGPGSG